MNAFVKRLISSLLVVVTLFELVLIPAFATDGGFSVIEADSDQYATDIGNDLPTNNSNLNIDENKSLLNSAVNYENEESDDQFSYVLLMDDTYQLERINVLSENIVIPSVFNGKAVTSIGKFAFSETATLVSVTIPDSVTEIGEGAFGGCINLRNVSIGNGVARIGEMAFIGCINLRNVSIGNGVTRIGEMAFIGCINLKSIAIPDSVDDIGPGAFSNCSSLEIFEIPDGITHISSHLFDNCTSLTSVILPDGVTGIDELAFAGCINLKSIAIPDSVDDIGPGAFLNCSNLDSIAIPNGVVNMGNDVFEGCNNLSFNVYDNAKYLGNEQNQFLYLFEAIDQNITSINIYRETKFIADRAFESCRALNAIIMPDGVTSIGQCAFESCSNLSDIIIPNSVTSIGMSAFVGCSSLTDITLPNGLSIIDMTLFSSCAKLENITIPNSVTRIEYAAFVGCTSLKSIYIPAFVEHIDENAFAKCPNLVIYCERGSYAEQYALNNNIKIELLVPDHIKIDLIADGTKLTEGYTVQWYNSNLELIGEGTAIYGVDEQAEYFYSITLGSELEKLYSAIDIQRVVANGKETNVVVNLPPISTVKLSGYIVDEDGNSINNAKISIVQMFGTSTSTNLTEYADANGYFEMEIYNVPTKLDFFADGYYNNIKKIFDDDRIVGRVELGKIKLVKLSANEITLTGSIKRVDLEGNGRVKSLTSFDNFEFSLYNKTKEKQIKTFAVRGSSIFIGDGEASPFDTLTLTATDKNGEVNDVSVDVSMDAKVFGFAVINAIEKGHVRIDCIQSSKKSIVMIFDSYDRCIQVSEVGSVYISDVLDDGKYKVIVMQQMSALPHFRTFSDIFAMGFDNHDYALIDIEIKQGIISTIDSVSVPEFDESKICYTVKDKTYLRMARNSMLVGQYVNFNVSFEIDHKFGNTSNHTMVVNLPESVTLVDGSVSLDSKPVSYIHMDGVLKVITGGNSGVLRFYAIASSVDECMVTSYLTFDYNGNNIMQSIGTVKLDIEISTITVPSQTSNADIVISGKAIPQSQITVYDGDTVIATAKSNAAGSWSACGQLVNAFSYSYHNIYAIVENEKLEIKNAKTKSAIVTHNVAYSEAEVTMINNFQTIIFDIDSNSGSTTYSFNPSFPVFTFVVKFGEASSNIKDVNVITTDASDRKITIPCLYDSQTNRFIGTYNYTTNNLPQSVEVTYNFIDETVFTMSSEKAKHVDEVIDKVYNDIFTDLEDKLIVENIHADQDIVSFDIVDSSIDKVFASAYMVESDYSALDLENGKFVPYIKGDGDKLMAISHSAQGMTVTFVDKTNKEAVDLVLLSGAVSTYKEDNAVDKLVDMTGHISSALDMILLSIGYFDLEEMVKKSQDAYIQNYNEMKNSFLYMKCPDGSYKLSSNDMLTANNLFNANFNAAEMGYNSMWDDLDAYRLQVLTHAAVEIESFVISKIKDILHWDEIMKVISIDTGYKNPIIRTSMILEGLDNDFNGIVEDLTSIENGRDVLDASLDTYKYLTDESGGLESQIDRVFGDFDQYKVDTTLYLSLIEVLNRLELDNQNMLTATVVWIGRHQNKCSDDENDDKYKYQPDGRNSTGVIVAAPIIDPSGYVCEAVPSNRLENVKVEAYYYDYALDESGSISNSKSDIFWDAEQYDQINPLYTDSDGRYSWDVPFGQWLVKFSKEGYYDADSSNDPAADEDGYLPVPPPQTEVNIALVSKELPYVSKINAYSDEIRIEFSQYMDMTSINTNNIKVYMGDVQVKGGITPVNSEASFNNPDVQYASVFLFKPDDIIVGEVSIEISSVINYAGNSMSKSYARNCTVELRPESIEVTEALTVEYGGGALISVKLLPTIAGVNKKITVMSTVPNIVIPMENVIVTDENGCATVMISGDLPGLGNLHFEVEGTDIEADVSVKVADVKVNDNSCSKVVSNIVNGSIIEKGTIITLTTATEGADIYYTLDRTCPYDEDNPARQKYTDPLVIDQDTFIIAYAVKDGIEESLTTGFSYTIHPPHKHNNSWEISDSGHWRICTFCDDVFDSMEHDFGASGNECIGCGYKKYITGDTDGNERIDANDAIYVLMHTFFPNDYPINQPCDFDGNGKVDANDAIYLLMHTFFPNDYPITK